ncbi:MAG: phage head-tail connector protein [Eubacteriales bacterium]|nr:phage head-tail connector protein [Eubacteriales bacterium]
MTAFRALLPGETISDSLALALLESACDTLYTLTNRTFLPNEMRGIILRLAVIRYNLLGQEGETKRKEGSFSIDVESLPEDVLREIKAWRIGKIGL